MKEDTIVLQEPPKSSGIDQQLLLMLESFQENLKSLEARHILATYLALLCRGNSFISLDANSLIKKCENTWKRSFSTELKYQFEKGCQEILDQKLSQIVSYVTEETTEINKPFVVDTNTNSLFATKYWKAKNVIVKTFAKENDIFSQKETTETNQNIINYVEGILQENSPIKLNEAQAEAIRRGQKSNLLITGGPGTGKTTVILFLLWKLLSENQELKNWNLFFAAPSGKAANRLKESLDLNEIRPEILQEKHASEIAELIKNANSLTMHRLLRYQANQNSFYYNENKPFPDHSIFVIDEASMIDISLFAAFLKALPRDHSKFKLYILGDKDQLPSVNAGAVLGEVLGIYPDYMVKLTESNRFLDDSKMGRFAHAIQEETFDACKNSIEECGGFQPFNPSVELWASDDSQVKFISIDNKVPKKQLREVLSQWVKKHCASLLKLAKEIDPSSDAPCGSKEWKARKELWKQGESARILSAERQGLFGVESLNEMIRQIMQSLCESEDSLQNYFSGEILMFNRNQNTMELFNGDSGIVVKKEGVIYLMIKKGNEYPCYMLSMFPSDCLETAFAITIHKSQGSGYENILMFLPTNPNHALLNRQILYTGVTRTKITRIPKENSYTEMGSLVLVTTENILEKAWSSIEKRDTGIHST